MRVYLASLLMCCGLGAQIQPPITTIPPSVYLINAGGPDLPVDTGDPANPIPAYQADAFYTTSVAWVDPGMGTGIWGTLRFAPTFSYDIAVPNGFYSLKFDLLEPNKTGPSQRVFTISVNGTTSDPIDIFATAKAINVGIQYDMMSVVGNGHLRITFQASVGNAVVSAIEITPSLVFGGIETHFVRIFTCAPPLSDSMCIQTNPQTVNQ